MYISTLNDNIVWPHYMATYGNIVLPHMATFGCCTIWQHYPTNGPIYSPMLHNAIYITTFFPLLHCSTTAAVYVIACLQYLLAQTGSVLWAYAKIPQASCIQFLHLVGAGLNRKLHQFCWCSVAIFSAINGNWIGDITSALDNMICHNTMYDMTYNSYYHTMLTWCTQF